MDRRRRKELNRSENFTSNGIVYIDNVSSSAGEALVNNSAALSISFKNTSSYSLKPNAPDSTFYEQINIDATTTSSFAIVITADRGKGDPGILQAINLHEKDGNICTIMVSIKSLYGPNIDIALAALSKESGFKEIQSYPKRFLRIILSRSGRDLIIQTDSRATGQRKTKRAKNIFSK